MNTVQKIAIDFTGEDEFFFRSLYADWELYWTSKLENATERIVEKYNEKAYTIEIDTLELQLGSIAQSDFNTTFLEKYEAALEEALLQSMHGNGTLRAKKMETKRNYAELLFHFLLHGSLPWQAHGQIKNLNVLFLEVAQKDAKSLRDFLMTYGHYTSLQQRLILQFDEKTLKTGVKITAPSESHFILSYIDLVQSRHKELRSPEINTTQYHQTIWQVVYAYLLNNKSSFFNKKIFLEQTIRQLSNHYLLNYSDLLRLLLLNTKQSRSFPIELITLLQSLRKEEEVNLGTKREWKSWINYLMLSDKDLVSHLSKDIKALIKLLQNENNYLLLELLNEKQTLQIVEIVVPQQHQFIKVYARELEQQKENGILQGKAGSEFRLVKWQILFPILLENNGTGFNRRYFVERVLQKVAARYNLTLIEILEYLKKDAIISRIDKQLVAILNEIHLQYNQTSKLPEKINNKIHFSDIIKQLHSKEIPVEETKKWIIFLQDETVRNQFLQQLSEQEHYRLIHILYKTESQFILAYDSLITKQQAKGALKNKSSKKLNTLKWQFIHEVLLVTSKQVFNKRYFVESITRKIASQNNLKFEELVSFIYGDLQKNNSPIPFELVNILAELQKEQQKKREEKEIRTSEISEEEFNDFAVTEKFLRRHFGNEQQLYFLIRKLAAKSEFIRFIQSALEIESEWRKFVVLQFSITISKKQLLLLLLRISISHQQLNKSSVLQKIMVFFFSQLQTTEQKVAFQQHLDKSAETSYLLKQSIEFSSEKEESIEEPEELIVESVEQSSAFISNAGLILVAPFLPRLFAILHLTEDGKFKDREAQVRAIFLLQYAVFGSTEFPEYELQLNKLLTGFNTGEPLPNKIDLTEQEMKTTESMLQGVMQNWTKVKSIEGLLEGFLQREGKLNELDETIELTVESKAFDMLLDSVPWNFKTTKFSWMEKTILTNWR